MSKVNWGVLGTGKIVEKGGLGIASAANSRWLGIAGRHAESSKQAAAKYNLEKTYENYADLLADPDIDAVYIALLNHMHCEWTIKAIEAGKHVLLEKPFALNAAEALRIQAAADKHGKQVMEAHVWHYQPAFQWIKAAVQEGRIGDVGIFRGGFHFVLAGESTRWRKEWGGGCLYDVGIYPVSWSRYFMVAEPEAAVCDLLEAADHGVDKRFSGTLYYQGGRIAQVSAAFDLQGGIALELIGSAGTIRLQNQATHERMETVVRLSSTAGAEPETHTWTSDRIAPFRLQAEAFAQAMIDGQSAPRGGAAEGVAHMRILDALFEAHRSQGRVRVQAN